MATARYYSVKEAAVHLGKSERAIWCDIYRGKIPHKRHGRRVLIPIAALERFLDLLPGVSAEAAAARVAQGGRLTAGLGQGTEEHRSEPPATAKTIQEEAAKLVARRKAA